jgi:hypothetical protein
MLINLLFFISGGITSIGLLSIIRKIKKHKVAEPTYLRKGLHKRSFNITSGLGAKSTMDVEFEVGEIESSSKKSKIKILNTWIAQSQHDNDDNKEKIKSMVDGTWIDKNDVEWLENSLDVEREEKLKKILN